MSSVSTVFVWKNCFKTELFTTVFSSMVQNITVGNICPGFQKAGIVAFNPDALSLTKSSTVTTSTGSDVKGLSITTHDFTPDEEEVFATQFEEGYDLFNRRYEEWLKVNHSPVSTVQPAHIANCLTSTLLIFSCHIIFTC